MNIAETERRIVNVDDLVSHGNKSLRKAMVQILEAGMAACDPYINTRRLIHISENNLLVGHNDFEPVGCPRTGDEVFDLSH